MSEITEILFGTKELIIKPLVILKVVINRKFWFDKIEYWIEWEYVRLGPYKSYSEASDMLAMYYYAHNKR